MQLKERIRGILRKEFPGDKHWRSFIYWWLAANGYDHESRRGLVDFVDGAGDGGIDAIAWPLDNQARNEVLVLQSKFFGQPPSDRDLSRFEQAITAFQGSHECFQKWLETCREDLHALYRRLREERRRHRYVIIAPCRFEGWQKRSLRNQGIQVHDTDLLTNLERIYVAGKTPRLDEIRITSASAPRAISEANGTRVWIFTVGARELGLLYERYGDDLFAGNVRYALRGQTARRVRHGMLETLEEHHHEFVFSHNGVTITGDGIKRRNKHVVLKSATIVNGAQTVSYLGSPKVMSRLTRNPARLIVKFVEVGDPEMLNDIESKVAFRSNNQNKVEPSDLMIELSSLVSLQRYFRRHGVHLERKKGEQRLHYGELRISKERLAQVLAAAESPQGAVKAKSKQKLFMEVAHTLFSDYDASESARAEAVAWARVDEVFWTAIYQFANSKRRKRAQIAQLASLTVFNRVLRSTGLKSKFLRIMNRWDSESESITWFIERSCKSIMAALLQCSARHRKNEPAFYKALDSVKPAVETAMRRSRAKIRRYFADYLGH